MCVYLLVTVPHSLPPPRFSPRTLPIRKWSRKTQLLCWRGCEGQGCACHKIAGGKRTPPACCVHLARASCAHSDKHSCCAGRVMGGQLHARLCCWRGQNVLYRPRSTANRVGGTRAAFKASWIPNSEGGVGAEANCKKHVWYSSSLGAQLLLPFPAALAGTVA